MGGGRLAGSNSLLILISGTMINKIVYAMNNDTSTIKAKKAFGFSLNISYLYGDVLVECS